MPAKAKPAEILPTHEYRFTRLLTFQYNSEFHVVRVMEREQIIQDWSPPSITIDLNQFELLPLPPGNFTKIQSHVDALYKRGRLTTIMAKWKKRLPIDQYAELLDDLRAAVLASEHEMMHEIKTAGKRPDLTLIDIINRY